MTIMYPKKAKTQGHLRKIIVEDYKRCGNSVEVAEKYSVSHSTVLKWSKSESLENRSSAPKIPARKHDFKILVLIYFLYKKQEENIDAIQDILEKQQTPIARSTIGYYLRIWGLTKERKEAGKRISQKFKKYDPGFVHIDITYGPKINGIKYYIHVAIDRATRMMYYEVHDNKRADTAASFLEKAIAFFPFKVSKILTDNGKEYTLKNHKGKHDLTGAFDLICQEYDIEHRTTKPYTPQTNGMAEKANDTIKSNTLKIHIYENADEMKLDLIQFLIHYILSRKHSGLVSEIGVKTPFQALEYWYKLSPELFKENPMEFKEKLLIMKKNL